MHSQGKTSEDEEEGQLLGTFSYKKSGPPIQEYTLHVCCSSYTERSTLLLKQNGHLVHYDNGCFVSTGW